MACPFSLAILLTSLWLVCATRLHIYLHLHLFSMVDLALLQEIRDENAFVFSSRACFAIISPTAKQTSPESLWLAISTFVNLINSYSPLRVKLEVTTADNCSVIEMKYSSATEQTYFSHLMWTFSRDNDAWIHIWDTHEHDALRRDFSAPAYMDSLLCINRLWINRQLVFMITKSFTEENPHGELIEELTLSEALECLHNHEVCTPAELNNMAKQLQSPMMDAVVDVRHVYLPKSLVLPLATSPWLISPVIADPTLVVTSTLASLVDLDDEVQFTMAVPQFLIEQAVKSSLTIAQSVSLGIKANMESHLQSNPQFGDSLKYTDNVSGQEIFLLEYLQSKLVELRILPHSEEVVQIDEAGGRFVSDWNKPFSIFSPQEEREWTKAEELKAQQLEALLKLDLDEDLPDEIHLSMPLGEDRSTVEKLQGLLRNFKSAIGETLGDTDLKTGMYESLNDEDVEKLTQLDDFEDFIEFFAQNYMGFDEDDLAAHHHQKKRPAEQETEEELELGLEVDWEAYNNDSDYKSDNE